MESDPPVQLPDRAADLIHRWRVAVDRTMETETSWLAFGNRDGLRVVLKIIKSQGDEWHCGEILEAFEGHGVVRVYERSAGAILMERLEPGNSLVEMSVHGSDNQATDILAAVVREMSPCRAVSACVTVQEWAEGFDRYTASGDKQIPNHLVEEGRRIYSRLSSSQRSPRLLHGDLHHYNVLCDSERGWVAIDPKGVVGEIEYEIGAALRNPFERPEIFAQAITIESRLKRFASRLDIDIRRALAWGFAQAVLSAIWLVEDGFQVDTQNPSLLLAEEIRKLSPLS